MASAAARPPGGVTGSFAETGRQGTGGDNRADPGEHECHGGEDVSGEFAEPPGRARIFELDARGRIELLSEGGVLVVIPADHRDAIVLRTRGVHRTCTSRGASRVMRKDREPAGVACSS